MWRVGRAFYTLESNEVILIAYIVHEEVSLFVFIKRRITRMCKIFKM